MKKYLLNLALFLSITSIAQTPGEIAQSFGSFPGLNGFVGAIQQQTDGKILVGGGFTSYNGVTENRIIRFNTDGTKDISFNSGTGFNAVVRVFHQQTDGKILVGGEFTSYNGGTENFIIRLNTDGTKDTSFNSGTGFNGSVWAIKQQTDGKILVGGDFTSYNGVTENRIIRLNADGTKDTSFNSGSGFDAVVRAFLQQTDGKILVGGGFTSYNGVTENRIIRLNTDGTKDISFNSGTGFNTLVYTITLQTDGKILVGGGFTSYNGVTENRIIRLNTNGTKDTSFNSGIGFNNFVWAITIQTDGKILVGGSFTSYNGGTENFIIRLNTDGTKDTSFNSGSGFNNIVYTITIQTDGKILVGGVFKSYNGVTENRIIGLNTDGTKDTSFNSGTGFNNFVRAIQKQTDGKILVGGDFTSYNGMIENRIIRLNADGTKDTSFNSGTGFNGSVYTITLQTDGKILVGGSFNSYNGVTENRIIRLNTDGTKDTSFNSGSGFNTSVWAITIQTDGKILVGGDFTSYNGVTENRIIRLNTDGTKDTSFNSGSGFDNIVRAFQQQTDGKILVAGSFTSYNGVTENRIIRLNTDGTLDTSFNSGSGFNSNVWSIKQETDGKILVGGDFTSYNGVTENRIIRLNTDGTLDTSFNSGTGFNSSVWVIIIQTDGKILVGGLFTTYKGDNSSAYLIGLHGETVLSSASFTNANSFVLYPNPVKDVLHFQSNDFSIIKKIKIYDLQGKLVLENTEESINVSQLSNGFYLAKITTEEGEVIKKFIKE